MALACKQAPRVFGDGASIARLARDHRHSNRSFTRIHTFHPLAPVNYLDHLPDDIAHLIHHAVNHRRNTVARQ